METVPDDQLDATLRVLNVVWLAVAGALAVYLAVGLAVAPGFASPARGETVAVLRTSLYALAVVILVATRYVRRFILFGRGPAEPPAPSRRQTGARRYANATIISLALSESVGILGLVLVFLGRNHVDLYLLLAVSAVAVTAYRPRKEALRDMALQVERGDGIVSS